jgi:gluconolactonase
MRRHHNPLVGWSVNRSALAPMMASVTFGGPDLRTVYLGSLGGNTLSCFRSPVAGLRLAHWKS